MLTVSTVTKYWIGYWITQNTVSMENIQWNHYTTRCNPGDTIYCIISNAQHCSLLLSRKAPSDGGSHDRDLVKGDYVLEFLPNLYSCHHGYFVLEFIAACFELIYVSPKLIYWSLTSQHPQNVTLFEDSTYREVIKVKEGHIGRS